MYPVLVLTAGGLKTVAGFNEISFIVLAFTGEQNISSWDLFNIKWQNRKNDPLIEKMRFDFQLLKIKAILELHIVIFSVSQQNIKSSISALFLMNIKKMYIHFK